MTILASKPAKETTSAPAPGKKKGMNFDPANFLDAERPTVIDKIATFIERFVWLQDPSLYRLISLWIIATHRYQLFDYAGYVFAYSVEPSSGKSRLLEVIDRLVYNSSGVLISPTEPVVFRTAFDATQILDELDSMMNLDYLKSVLNGGFQAGSHVPRMVQINNTFVKEDHPIFAPRALAGISKNILSQTTLDRSFPINMVKKTKEEKCEKFRPRKLKTQIERLRYDIEMFWIHNEDRVAEIYDDDNSFPYLEKFRDRTVDIAEPLTAVLEAVYLDHSQHAPPEGALEADRLKLITAISITRDDQVKEFLQHRILQALAQIAKKENPLIGSPKELAERCSRLSDKPTEFDISAALRLYGFKSVSKRLGGDPKYRYVLESK